MPETPSSPGARQSAIFVTRPSLPPRGDLDRLLDGIWERRILTNGGPLHQRFEAALAAYLGISHVCVFTNATTALAAALKALDLQGEVITTPFSFVGTSHVIAWQGLQPVFCDIDPGTLNLDPGKIEALITPQTSAIMPVHCYGHPCDVHAIAAVARRHGLPILYDAAHAFGVDDPQGSILRHGDLSVVSFHATKVFTTFEGGAIAVSSPELKARIERVRNFGFEDEITVTGVGINGKMSELHAAVGICQLPHVDGDIERRSKVAKAYVERLSGLPGLRIVGRTHEVRENHAYFPILVGPGFPSSRDAVYEHLRAQGVFARRYFYPLISDFPMYRSLPSAAPASLPSAQRAAREVLCLPMSPDMAPEDVERVCAAIEELAAHAGA